MCAVVIVLLGCGETVAAVNLSVLIIFGLISSTCFFYCCSFHCCSCHSCNSIIIRGNINGSLLLFIFLLLLLVVLVLAAVLLMVAVSAVLFLLFLLCWVIAYKCLLLLLLLFRLSHIFFGESCVGWQRLCFACSPLCDYIYSILLSIFWSSRCILLLLRSVTLLLFISLLPIFER